MRTRLYTLALLLLCGGALPACSALGLDNLPQADCVRGGGGMTGDAFCASLATLNPPLDTCHTWQCNEQSHHCEQLARDDDGDGAPTMMCAAGATPDCDDADMDNHPGGTETCNGHDQDCDGVADNGVVTMTETSGSITTINTSAFQTLFAELPDTEEVMLLARYEPTRLQAVTITATMPASNDLALSQTGTGAIMPQNTDVAITGLGRSTYALAARRQTMVGTTRCQQWQMFPVTSMMGGVVLRAADESLVPACPTTGSQDVTAPAVAGHSNGATPGSTVLVAWLVGTDDARSCGAAAALPVMISAVGFDDRTTAHNRVSPDAIMLGTSVDNAPPVVLALDDAFLVAYARADMTVAVHLVTTATDGTGVLHVTASATPDYVEPAGAMVRQGVGLALGPTTSGASSIALSYYEGCGGQNPITVRLLSRSGAAITASSTPATNLGTGAARSRVQVVYQPRASEWLVGWRSGSGVAAQRLFHDGATEGEAFDLAPMPTVTAYVVRPLASGALYRTIVVNGTSIDQTTFGCGAAAP